MKRRFGRTGIGMDSRTIFIVISLALVNANGLPQPANECHYQLVESLPELMPYERPLGFEMAKTSEAWLELIEGARNSIRIASFYLKLLSDPVHASHPSAEPGRLVFEALEVAARERNVTVEIIVGADWSGEEELKRMREAGIDFRIFEIGKLTNGGVQHSKFIITDEENFYLGSANLDWRALTQVKEFGIVYKHCEALAKDLLKIFDLYSLLTGQITPLAELPPALLTNKNMDNPFTMNMDAIPTEVYLGASPDILEGDNNNRTSDLNMILDTISKAEKFVYISVMNYSPVFGFKSRTFWPVIDNALRAAYYERRIKVKLLVSKWAKPLRREELDWYRSLNALNSSDTRWGGIEVKLFQVPAESHFHKSIPFARIKHDKYIVTDNRVFIGTSNWAPSYFLNTSGVGISIRPSEINLAHHNIVSHTKAFFERDYYSEYASRLNE